MADAKTVGETFLPRDRGEALIDVTERLYERLRHVEQFVMHDQGYKLARENEAYFLRSLIDIIERS